MISKLIKAQEHWLFKSIFIAVAISFISLFGVTGYINTASQNRDVIDVDGIKTSQSEFAYRLQKELNALQKIGGDDFEISDELRSSIAEGVIRQIIDENVLDKTLENNDIYFPKDFIRQVIFSQPEFVNPLNGKFNRDLYLNYLSTAGISENEYVNIIKRLMARKLLISDLVNGFDVPDILSSAIHKMDNQRRSFKYITVSPNDVKIERQISDDEIKQYFEDFAESFVIPETREADVLYIPIDNVLNKYAASDEMIKDYYAENKKSFDQPEKREVLQMVFLNEADANKALNELNNGKSFSEVAKELNAENKDEPTLGLVAQDELADELAYSAFELDVNTPKLIQIADSWQVISVKQIIAAKESTFDEVKDKIAESLKNENMYDALREVKAEIDDAINAGESLEKVAERFNIPLVNIKNIRENELLSNVDENVKSLASSLDLNELIFSYSLDETTSSEEFSDAIVVARVTKIIDEHMPIIDEVKDEIVKIWTEQEKNALAKEIADDIVNDINDNKDIADAAKSRELEVFRSEPISRNDTFANLTSIEINDLFLANNDEVKLFEHSGNNYVIVVTFETVNYQNDLTEENLEDVNDRAKESLYNDMSKAVLDNYASDLKVKVDYERAGFGE